MNQSPAERILSQYAAELKQGLNELAGRGTAQEQAKTQLRDALLDWLPEDLSQDPDDYTESHHYAEAVGRNNGNREAQQIVREFFGGSE